jgi:hypothetical protein
MEESKMPLEIDAELQKILKEYQEAQSRSHYDDCSDVIKNVQLNQLQTRCIAAVERGAGRNSAYYRQVTGVLDAKDHAWNHLAAQVGVVQSLLHDIQNGYLRSVEEVIHGELFGDFLEMSDHLVSNGYKDAAAVIAGSTLESHLRQLCKKAAITTEHNGKPKKADALNSELAAAGVYSKLDQKNVTAWLGLRNDAAHGNYAAYDKNQVALLVSSIRDFVTRNPA